MTLTTEELDKLYPTKHEKRLALAEDIGKLVAIEHILLTADLKFPQSKYVALNIAEKLRVAYEKL